MNTFLLAFIELGLLVPIATAGCVALLVFVMVDAMTTPGQSRSEQRLDQFNSADDNAPAVKKENALVGFLLKSAPKLSGAIQPKPKQMTELQEKMSYAGYRTDDAAAIYLGLKVMCGLFGFVMSSGFSLFYKGFNFSGAMWAFIGTGFWYFLPEIILSFKISSRKQKIFLGLPDSLDLMVVCVEAGLALDQAMRKVSEEMVKSHPIVAEEFGYCNMQLQMGRPRAEVLHDLGQRTGVDDLRQLASVLVQADKFGSSVGAALRVQSESMRTRRRQIAEEKAAKTAVQLIFPLVLFIFPAIFVVLVGPAAIQMAETLLPALGGE